VYGQNGIEQLPLGKNKIIYQVSDACGNSDTCSIILEVIDLQPPIAICDQFTKVSLGIDGTARLNAESIDDGSHDNCAIAKMEVMKMDTVCSEFQDRGPFVEFCCAETGMEVMVAFIVTDIYGNENTCMVTVEVEDKLPPQIICPTDLTLDCNSDFHWEDLDRYGKIVLNKNNREIIKDSQGQNIGLDGWVEDNCQVSVSDTFIADIECSQGQIIRTFTAVDQQGNSATCNQYITFVNNDPFDSLDIHWPLDFIDTVCVDTSFSEEISGIPTWDNEVCGQIASTYKDQVFPFASEACLKIIRNWTVIDWCQYDRDQEGEGIWNYEQIIKLENTTAPIFDDCQDTILCSFVENCGPAVFDYQIKISDDCTHPDELDIYWQIYINDLPENVVRGEGLHILANLPLGKHTVKIESEDRCGNLATCTRIVDVVDCKAPTPHCITSVTTVLMETNDSIEIWAKDFNFQSYDNCTSAEDLKYSFSSDTAEISRFLSCKDITNGISETVALEMWVTDLAGNQEFCRVEVILQDNKDNCEDNEEVTRIEGTVVTYENIPLEGVTVELESLTGESFSPTLTNSDGAYAFPVVPTEFAGDLIPDFDDNDPRKGINTLDIVKIQRHILGKTIFDTPYKILASDVNNSGKITGSDLLILRKLILGLTSELPENVKPWRFIDASIEITDDNLWDIPDGIFIDQLLPDINIFNFVGFKIGDVDHSWNELDRANITTREGFPNNTYTIQYNVEATENRKNIKYVIKEDIFSVTGMQFALEIPEGFKVNRVNSKLPNFSDNHYFLDGNQVKISWNEEIDLNKGTLLLELEGEYGKDFFTMFNESQLQAEIYVGLKASTLQLEPGTIISTKEEISGKIIQNPFYNHLVLDVSTAMEKSAELSLFDVGGTLIESKNFNLLPGHNRIDFGNFQDLNAGTYFVSIITDRQKTTLKAVKVD
jgi:hypothetical protein